MATVSVRPPAAEQARAAERRRRRRRSAWRRQLVALAFMSPWIIGFAVFYVYPILSSLYFSFTSYDILTDPVWVGLANYQFMFTSDGRSGRPCATPPGWWRSSCPSRSPSGSAPRWS